MKILGLSGDLSQYTAADIEKAWKKAPLQGPSRQGGQQGGVLPRHSGSGLSAQLHWFAAWPRHWFAAWPRLGGRPEL
jgi:hypothetical protein